MITLESILDKLKQVESQKADLANVFGAESHRYQVLPPVTTSAITEWETLHQICLPVEYSDFLTTVHNGPCGPGVGLMPFPHDNPNAGKPCLIQGSVSSVNPDEDQYYHQFVDGQNGFIRVSGYGCAIYAILILSGEFAGQIWIDGAGSGDLSQFPPVLHDLSRDDLDVAEWSFLDWYNDWLDCVLDGRAIS